MEGPLPNGAATSPGAQYASLGALSCTASGSCLAVGSYTTAAGNVLPFTESVSNAAPSNPAAVQIPGNSLTPNQASLQFVSCWSTGSCAAVGSYQDASGDTEELAVPIVGGMPESGVEVSLPPGSDSSMGPPGLSGVACQSTGACLAVGSYFDTADSQYAMVTPITNATVGAGMTISFPSNAAANGTGSDLSAVSCPPAGACLAIGWYTDTSGNADGLSVSFSGANVSPGVQAAAPPDNSTAPFDHLEAVGCGTSGSCLAAGDEVDQSSVLVPYVVSAGAPVSITTTTLPGDVVGRPYQAPLSATGAWGSYTWSLNTGHLLPGLSLSQTGVISGAPRASGTDTFSVKATSSGSPVQTATQSLSLKVAASKLRLTAKSAVVQKNRVTLRVGCSLGGCEGIAKLEITETVAVKHGKKRVHKNESVVIGSAHFSVAEGKTGTVKLSLNGAGVRALASHSPLPATLIATVSGVKETVGHVTLRAAPALKKKKH